MKKEHIPYRKPLPTLGKCLMSCGRRSSRSFAEHELPYRTGRPRADQRAVFDAITFRLRSGCQWTRLPKDLPDDSSVHRTFGRWVGLSVIDRIWQALVEECEEPSETNRDWQAADPATGKKARFGRSHRS